MHPSNVVGAMVPVTPSNVAIRNAIQFWNAFPLIVSTELGIVMPVTPVHPWNPLCSILVTEIIVPIAVAPIVTFPVIPVEIAEAEAFVIPFNVYVTLS